MTYLVDTDRLASYLNGRPDAVALLSSLRQDGLAVSIITYGEIYDGIYSSNDPCGKEAAFLQVLRRVEVLPLTRTIMKRFARLRGDLRRRGLLIGDPGHLDSGDRPTAWSYFGHAKSSPLQAHPRSQHLRGDLICNLGQLRAGQAIRRQGARRRRMTHGRSPRRAGRVEAARGRRTGVAADIAGCRDRVADDRRGRRCPNGIVTAPIVDVRRLMLLLSSGQERSSGNDIAPAFHVSQCGRAGSARRSLRERGERTTSDERVARGCSGAGHRCRWPP